MDSSEIYYVYAYLDPSKDVDLTYENIYFEFEPFYIGKGKGDRCDSHIKEYLNLNYKNLSIKEKKNIHRKFHKINKIFQLGLPPIVIKLAENLSELDAYDLEKSLIISIGRREDGGSLFNYRTGGYEGGSLGEDSKIKISKSLEEYRKLNGLWDWDNNKGIPYNKGVPMTKEAKENLRQKNLGKKHSKETIIKRGNGISKAWKERRDEIKTKREQTIIDRGIVKDYKKIGNKISETKKGNVVVSEEQRIQISNTLKSKPLLTCPHCGKKVRGSNAINYHFDKCLKNPNIDKSKLYKCKYCGILTNNKGSYNRFHDLNCKLKNVL